MEVASVVGVEFAEASLAAGRVCHRPRAHGAEVRIAMLPSSAVLGTRTIAEMTGFMKVLVEAQSDRILGFTMLGPEAGEVMAMVQTASRIRLQRQAARPRLN